MSTFETNGEAPPVTVLEPRIRAILTAPDVDFQLISAKRVRRQLADNDTITESYVRAHKSEIDKLITQVFAEISEELGLGGAEEDEGEEAREQEHGRGDEQDEEGEEEVDEDEERPTKRKRVVEYTKAAPSKKKKAGKEMSDAELARQIDSELNGRQRRSRTSAAGTARGGKANGAKKRKVKSADTVDSDGEGTPKPKRKGGFSKEYVLSEPLAAMLQTDRMSRPQVVKGLWDHIKGNDLQNPENKREIICDDALRAIFKTDKIGMFQMNKVLGQHLSEPES